MCQRLQLEGGYFHLYLRDAKVLLSQIDFIHALSVVPTLLRVNNPAFFAYHANKSSFQGFFHLQTRLPELHRNSCLPVPDLGLPTLIHSLKVFSVGEWKKSSLRTNEPLEFSPCAGPNWPGWAGGKMRPLSETGDATKAAWARRPCFLRFAAAAEAPGEIGVKESCCCCHLSLLLRHLCTAKC